MDGVFSLLLVFLELTFLFIGIALLHSQRKNIGNTPLYMAMGLIFLFGQFVSAADFRALIIGSIDFQISSTVFFLPYLAGLLLIYATDGTLATQRIIIGSLVLFGIFFYLGEITRLQCNWLGYSITKGQSAMALDMIIEKSMHSMAANVLALLADLFLLPIVYSFLKNLNCRQFIAITGALLLTQVADLMLYSLAFFRMQNNLMNFLTGAIIARFFFSIWLGIIITIYLGKTSSESKNLRTGAFDIIFAFFGAYGKSKKLEASLVEAEDRSRIILENASEMIMLLSPAGAIISSNIAANHMLRKHAPTYHYGSDIFQILKPTIYGSKNDDDAVYEKEEVIENDKVSYFKAKISEENYPELDLSCSLSQVIWQKEKILLLIARDVTQELKLQEEKKLLSEELAHSQRLESMGKLAGGIAHDYNNHLHAILGHVDLLTMLYDFDKNPDVMKHLNKITEIAEQSGKLTAQLLGFARKGKFLETTLNLAEIVNRSINMVPIPKMNHIVINREIKTEEAMIRGDNVQISQVVINLMLNAIDAMTQSSEKVLTVALDNAENFREPLADLVSIKDLQLNKFYCLAVGDTGEGIETENLKRIFEPFFTTKPVGEGTGMGLSMVYGTISNHHGFIHVASEVGKGSTFFVLLPKTSPTD